MQKLLRRRFFIEVQGTSRKCSGWNRTYYRENDDKGNGSDSFSKKEEWQPIVEFSYFRIQDTIETILQLLRIRLRPSLTEILLQFVHSGRTKYHLL